MLPLRATHPGLAKRERRFGAPSFVLDEPPSLSSPPITMKAQNQASRVNAWLPISPQVVDLPEQG